MPSALLGVVAPPAELPTDLEYLRKADLVALAEEHGLPSDGTRAELIARLRGPA